MVLHCQVGSLVFKNGSLKFEWSMQERKSKNNYPITHMDTTDLTIAKKQFQPVLPISEYGEKM